MDKTKPSNTHEVGELAKRRVVDEIIHRGAWAHQLKGIKNIVSASAANKSRHVSIRVRSRLSGGWQIRATEGREGTEPVDETNYWVLVDLSVSITAPEFYVIPDWWLRNDIYVDHKEWLESHGGIRPVTPKSGHHRVKDERIEKWKGRWDILKIF